MIDPNFPSAKIIAHSKAPNGEELITMEVELHRFILPEFNTHRSFSRNFQSSRAVPIEKMIEQVRNDPAMPVHWGKNQTGMVAESELDAKVYWEEANDGYCSISHLSPPEQAWKAAKDQAVYFAIAFMEAGYHKQLVNRLLEPFMKTKGVVTATKDAYAAFFKLRCHKDAQPEIKLLAERMQKALCESTPEVLQYGDYHLPYVHKDLFANREESKVTGKYLDICNAIKISTSCCSQVSYRRLDDSLTKALKVYDMLNLPVDGVYPEDPPHFSPTEHIARVMEDVMIESSTDYRTTHYYPDQTGNFNSAVFWQYRKALECGLEREFIE